MSRPVTWGVLALTLLAATAATVHAQSSVLPLDPINITPSAVVIRPRVFTGYGTLIGAAVMTVLYLYRGRVFILYWLGSFLLLATALGVTSRYDGFPPVMLVTDLALLSLALSAVMLRAAADAFLHGTVERRRLAYAGAAPAAWFVIGPAIASVNILVHVGMLMTAVLLAWAAVGYVGIARERRHLGAGIIALGLCTLSAAAGVALLIAFRLVADGTLLSELAVVNVVTSLVVAVGMLLLVFEELTAELRHANRELAAANESTRQQSVTDPLTGCHNRRFFEEIERREMNRQRRYGVPLSIVFIDVNHLKSVNDSEGHERGDEALRAIGALLRREVRQSDYVIRWGGDEFVLLLTCPLAVARYKAAGLKEAFREECEMADLPARLGLSIGVAEVAVGAEDLQDAIREADAAMYRDKLEERSSLQVRQVR